MGATVANRETFTSDTTDKKVTTRRTIECDIANNNVVLRSEGALLGWLDHEVPARETLAKIVVCVSLDRH